MPEYQAQLESITRLGRALGVTLILAAQAPGRGDRSDAGKYKIPHLLASGNP